MPELTLRDALRTTLIEEMERDRSVVLMGEDIGVYQGTFRVTADLLSRFGPQRVMDMPISELGFVGAAIGMAMLGLRPVVEVMTWNFSLLAMDQIVNQASKIRYMFGGQADFPVTYRCTTGGGAQVAAQHSQSPYSMFMHLAGLKIVLPSTPADAKGLLKASIRDPNPVIYCEHKYLYRHAKGEVPSGEYVLPLGQADVKRQGTDITLITYGAMVQQGLEAADQMSAQGIEVELVDLPARVHAELGVRDLELVQFQQLFFQFEQQLLKFLKLFVELQLVQLKLLQLFEF